MAKILYPVGTKVAFREVRFPTIPLYVIEYHKGEKRPYVVSKQKDGNSQSWKGDYYFTKEDLIRWENHPHNKILRQKTLSAEGPVEKDPGTVSKFGCDCNVCKSANVDYSIIVQKLQGQVDYLIGQVNKMERIITNMPTRFEMKMADLVTAKEVYQLTKEVMSHDDD